MPGVAGGYENYCVGKGDLTGGFIMSPLFCRQQSGEINGVRKVILVPDGQCQGNVPAMSGNVLLQQCGRDNLKKGRILPFFGFQVVCLASSLLD